LISPKPFWKNLGAKKMTETKAEQQAIEKVISKPLVSKVVDGVDYLLSTLQCDPKDKEVHAIYMIVAKPSEMEILTQHLEYIRSETIDSIKARSSEKAAAREEMSNAIKSLINAFMKL
jgi:hypothetical protein